MGEQLHRFRNAPDEGDVLVRMVVDAPARRSDMISEYTQGENAEGAPSPIERVSSDKQVNPVWTNSDNGVSEHTAVTAYDVSFRSIYRIERNNPTGSSGHHKEHSMWKEHLSAISQDFPFNTSPTIEDIIRRIAKEVPEEAWKELPRDCDGRPCRSL